jgi:asparagine synthase (glutamine-hydrolysing)
MCGIHLIWGKGANEEAIQKLVNSSQHRGPDQQAVYSPWPGLWVGVNRLKILDLTNSANQPFSTSDGNHLLVFNGEVYNHQELRKLISLMGVEVQTQSDTEVLLYYLKYFGTKGLGKVNGMFSLIFLDLTRKSVLIARDRNGEKPLYYSHNPDNLIISSEVRGIASLRETATDWDQSEHFFYFRAPAPGKTFYRGIREWKAGRYSTVYQPSTFRWDLIPDPKKSDLTPDLSLFEKTLTEAVSRQFHADVPVGMLLSGGSDSALLYANWYKKTGIPLPAFTIQVEKKYHSSYPDGNASKKLSRQIPMDLHLVPVDQHIFLENWEDYLHSIDLPIGDSSGFLTWLIGKNAKTHVKVLISGAGADELWGGYQRHAAFQSYLQKHEFWIKWAPLLKNLPLGRKRNKFLSGIHPMPNQTFLNFSALQNPPLELMEEYERVFNSSLPEYKRMLDFDRQVYLVQDVLKLVDNSLMAHGIEGRSPYLDSEFLGLWQNVKNPEFICGKPWIKQLLREDQLGWVADRKKMGFGLPLKEWLSEKGEFSSRVFRTLKSFATSHGENFSLPARQILNHPEKFNQSDFLTLYNLFLLAEWAKLHRL